MKSTPKKVKVSYNEEIHTIPFNLSFIELQEKIKNLYKNKLPPKFKIFYIDIEGDIISISCQEDLEEAQEIFGKENFPFKLMVDVNTESVRESIKIGNNCKGNSQSDKIINEKGSFVKVESNIDVPKETGQSKESINSLYEREEEKIPIQKTSTNINKNQNPEIPIDSENSIICQKCRGTGKELNNQPCSLCKGRGRNINQYPSLESQYSRSSSCIIPEKAFTCKLCNNPIKGIRYKCVICQSLDICEACENTFGHPHALLKIRDQSMDPKIILVVPRETNDQHYAVSSHQSEVSINAPIFFEMKEYEIQVQKETPSNPLHISPGQMFSKTFTFKNSGKKSWPVSTKMQVLGGDNLSGKEIHIGSLHPGKEIDITQMLKSPLIPGKYTQTFQIIYTDGFQRKFGFGQIFKIEIYVENNLKEKEKPEGKLIPSLQNDIEIPKEYEENARKLIQLGITDKEFIIDDLKQVKNDFGKVAELIFSKANPNN